MATLKTQIRIRRDIYDNLKNEILLQGEPGYATDTKKLAIGDGETIFANLKDYGVDKHVLFIEGNSSGKAGYWTGTSDEVTNYYDGLSIAYRINIAGASSPHYVTLQINNLAEIPVYKNTSRLTTHLPINTVVLLTYITVNGEGRFVWADYDSTVNYQMRRYYSRYKAKTKMYGYDLVFVDNEYVIPITKQATTGTKTPSDIEFNPFGELLYYYSSGDINAGSIREGYYFYSQILTDARYSFNNGSSLTRGNPVYLKCSLNTQNGKMKIASLDAISILPSTEDGFYYIYVGSCYDSYRIELSLNHPIYYYKHGAIRQYSGDIKTTDTVRAIKIDGVEKLTSSNKTALDLIAGSNVQLNYTKDGKVTISATDNDTKYDDSKCFYKDGTRAATGDFNLNNHSIKNLPKNGGIFWEPHMESSSDPSDAASVTVESTSGATKLVLKVANDTNDNVEFRTGSKKILVATSANASKNTFTFPDKDGTIALTSDLPPDPTGKYVLKTGDTMSGALTFTTKNAIKFKGAQSTHTLIRFIEDTANNWGQGIAIGGGGTTVIGGGESANLFNPTEGDEEMIIANDGAIKFYSNCQNDDLNQAKLMTYSSDGSLNIPGSSTASKFIKSSGTGIQVLMADGTVTSIQDVDKTGSKDYNVSKHSDGSLFVHVPWEGRGYWANLPVQSSGKEDTSPIFDMVTGNKFKGQYVGDWSPGTVILHPSYNGAMRIAGHINGGTEGLFDHSNNANSIITINKHEGNYDSQLGFSNKGRIYYRNFDGEAINTTKTWNKIAFTSDIPAVGNGTIVIKQNGKSKGSFTVNQFGDTTIELTDTDTVDATYTTTVSLVLKPEWQETGIKSNTNLPGTSAKLSDGTYVIQVYDNNYESGKHSTWSEYYSGIMSWYHGTNSSDTSEIQMHICGHARNGYTLFFRTKTHSHSSGGNVTLEVYCNHTDTVASNLIFKFRKII